MPEFTASESRGSPAPLPRSSRARGIGASVPMSHVSTYSVCLAQLSH